MSFTVDDVEGLQLPDLWRTAQTNDANFDISADRLNGSGAAGARNRTMFMPTGSSLVDWKTRIMNNIGDPVSDQDAVTKVFLKLENMSDVENPLPQTVAQYLVFDDVSSEWEAKLFSGAFTVDKEGVATLTPGGIDISDLADQTAGDILYWDVLNAAALLPIGSENQTLTISSGLLPIWKTPFLSPLTTDGDIMIFESSSDVRLPIGSAGQVLQVSVGLLPEWAAAPQTGHTIQDEGVDVLPQRINLDFKGPLVVATDNAVDATVVTVSGALPDLTDTNMGGQTLNEVLVFDGNFWVNKILEAAELPSNIAYQDQVNTFTDNNFFNQGLTIGASKAIDFNTGFAFDINHFVFNQTTTPPTPFITDSTIYMADGSDFNSSDPQLQTQIDRGGVVTIQPIVADESIFAMTQLSNGMFTEETGTKFSDPGGLQVRLSVFRESDDTASFEVVLDGQIFTITSPDVPTTSNSINLDVGLATSPTEHRVWIALVGSTPTMQSDPNDFPDTGDYAVVGVFSLQEKATVLSDGPYFANSPDYEMKDVDIRGHLAHINDRLVSLDSTYLEGIVMTVTPGVGDAPAGEVTFTSTAGEAFELHKETIEAYDIAAIGAICNINNDGAVLPGEVFRITNIGSDIVGRTCANGTTVIANNDRVNLVLYTVHQDTEPNATNYGVNLPFDVYGTDADAINDVDNFAITSIPIEARGVVLLVAEVVVKITGGGGTFEVIQFRDLRGQIPGVGVGSGGGGSGASELNDLTDVTIGISTGGVALEIDQILKYDGAGQWRNVDNPAGLLAGANNWLNYQDYNAILDPTTSGMTASVARFFIEIIDGNNTAMFTYLQRDGALQKVRIA